MFQYLKTQSAIVPNVNILVNDVTFDREPIKVSLWNSCSEFSILVMCNCLKPDCDSTPKKSSLKKFFLRSKNADGNYFIFLR